jgi:putative ABC transport system permease protein
MNDLRLAFRALRTTPIVTAVAILSLALGIGANTAIFSIVDSLVLRALPVREPQRLGLVTQGVGLTSSWTNPIWEQIRQRDRQVFDGAFAYSSSRFNLAQGGQTEFVDGLWASGRFFEILGVTATLGRTFGEADDRRGGGPDGPVAVISDAFWHRRLGGAADVIGRSIVIERVPFTIVGVTPPGFFGPDVGRSFDVVVPLGAEPIVRGKESFLDRRSTWWLLIMARLKPGQTIDDATLALRSVQPQIREATMPDNWRPQDLEGYLKEGFVLQPAATGSSPLRRRYQRPLLTIMVVVALVLLIACANIANLLLARAAARRHELSVRLALGASRLRLMRQLLVESLLLSGIGAALGLIFAQWGSQLLVRQLSTQTNTVFLDLPLDWRVLGFTAAAAIATAVLFGTAPAIRASRVQPIEAMKEHGRTQAGERRASLGSALVVVQVALSLVLVVAAGLFMRTFSTLANLNLGFERDPVLVVNVNAQRLQLEPKDRRELFDRVRRSVLSLTGVAEAVVSAVTPVSGSTWNNRIFLPHRTDLPERERGANFNMVTPGWFSTYGTPLRAGRDFDDRDRDGSPMVVIVNETFVRKFFSAESPLGRTFRLDARPDKVPPMLEIVGIAGDAVYRSLREPVPPTMFVPLAQHEEPPSSMSLSVRAAGGSPAMLTRSVAAAVGDVNKDLALTFRPLADQVNASLIQERVVAMLSGFFGGLALLLAGLGLYGVTSYAVSRRRSEIGIRMALGAAPGGVVRLVLTRVALLVAVGVAIGAAVSLWASRFVDTLLYGLTPRDPVTIVAAAMVLASVGALSGWLPARRAARIDPAEVLRDS